MVGFGGGCLGAPEYQFDVPAAVVERLTLEPRINLEAYLKYVGCGLDVCAVVWVSHCFHWDKGPLSDDCFYVTDLTCVSEKYWLCFNVFGSGVNISSILEWMVFVQCSLVVVAGGCGPGVRWKGAASALLQPPC